MTMKKRPHWGSVAAATAAAVLLGASRVMTQTACPQDANVQGFISLAAINQAMQDELDRIEGGGTPNNTYSFRLCPETAFDASVAPLRPVLNNAEFVCGANGNVQDNCLILAGDVQVNIQDSDVNAFPLRQVRFTGLTFGGFTSNGNATGTSILAAASSGTTATFVDTIWSDFQSDFVIRQTTGSSGGVPMNLQINNGQVKSGTTGVVFDNDGGFVNAEGLDVSGVSGASLMATANGGLGFLQNATVTDGSLESVTFTTAGGAQSVTNVNVNSMNGLTDVFFVEDSSSTLRVVDSRVSNNNIADTAWHVISVRNGAEGSITNSVFSSNAGLEHLVTVGGEGSRLTIQASNFTGNSGSAPDLQPSGVVNAIDRAQANLERVEISSNSDFTGAILAFFGSDLNVQQSCIQNAESEFVVFVDNQSSFQPPEQNFVGDYTTPQNRCPTGGSRLFEENAGAGCFTGGLCEGTCLQFADADQCLAQQAPSTPAPTASPTPAPVTAPTTSPTTAAPRIVPTATPSAGPSTAAPSTETPNPTATGPPTVAPTSASTTVSPTLQPVTPDTPTPTPPPTTRGPVAPTVAPTAPPTSENAPTSSPTCAGGIKKTIQKVVSNYNYNRSPKQKREAKYYRDSKGVLHGSFDFYQVIDPAADFEIINRYYYETVIICPEESKSAKSGKGKGKGGGSTGKGKGGGSKGMDAGSKKKESKKTSKGKKKSSIKKHGKGKGVVIVDKANGKKSGKKEMKRRQRQRRRQLRELDQLAWLQQETLDSEAENWLSIAPDTAFAPEGLRVRRRQTV